MNHNDMSMYAVGRDLFDNLDPPRPIGLIVSSVGGSTDQSWSSPEALDQCRHNTKGDEKKTNAIRWWEWPANLTASQLWNSKIVPLLRTVVKGVVWCARIVSVLCFLWNSESEIDRNVRACDAGTKVKATEALE